METHITFLGAQQHSSNSRICKDFASHNSFEATWIFYPKGVQKKFHIRFKQMFYKKRKCFYRNLVCLEDHVQMPLSHLIISMNQ